jgi:hypothetical protein
MRIYIMFSMLLCFFVVSNHAAAKDHTGKDKTKGLTLSNGRYEEFFDQDSIEQIGSVLYNVNTQRVVGFIEEDTVSSTVKPEIISRWLSIDPLASHYPGISPYVFVANNPIRNIDPDGRKFYNFNSSGDYVGTSHDNWFHNIFFKQGRVLDNNGNVARQFRFADRRNDTRAIENGTIKKVIIVTDDQMKLMVARSGGFDHDKKTANRTLLERYDYIRSEGVGLGRMDFSYMQIPRVFPEASSDPIAIPSSVLFLPPSPKATGEYAHNQMNFGNFMFGLSGQAQGFSLGELQYGAHYRALTQNGEDGYEPQLDSRDDQFSIGKGFEYGQSSLYDKKGFKVTPGTATPTLQEPTNGR